MSRLPRPSHFAPFPETLTPIHTLLFDALGPFSDSDLSADDDGAAADPFTLNFLDRFDRPSSPYGSEDCSPSLEIGDLAPLRDSDSPDFMDVDDPSLDLGLGGVPSASESFDSDAASRDAFDPPPYVFEEDPGVGYPWIGELEEIGGVVEEAVESGEVDFDMMGPEAEQALAEALDFGGAACAHAWRDGDGLEVDAWGGAEGVEVDAWCDAEGVEVVEFGRNGGAEAEAEAGAEASGDMERLDENWWGDMAEAETDAWGEGMLREVEEVEAEVGEVLMGRDGDDGRTEDLFDEEFTEALENIVAGRATMSGWRPAARSVLLALPSVALVQGEEGTICAVCKDEVAVGGVLKQLPCAHRYHEECILPWLRMRNTCPVCRFELPTDDCGYDARRAAREGGETLGDRTIRALDGVNSMLQEFLTDVLGPDQSQWPWPPEYRARRFARGVAER